MPPTWNDETRLTEVSAILERATGEELDTIATWCVEQRLPRLGEQVRRMAEVKGG